MRMVDIILKKKDGGELTTEEIQFFVQGCTKDMLPDYQISALLMAICLRGMTSRETADLTFAMTHSGDVIDMSAVDGIVLDKHSTGGVGDSTTLVVVPLVAACGGKVAKMSGRGLGHTGGTLDKLESIPGFNVTLPIERFIELVSTNGLAVVGQSENLAPADKRLYALRDVTGTVQSIPLIASSIMSKKLACGTDAMVLDVKTGSGAFMQTAEEAFMLAREMVDIGTKLGKNVTALITDMNQPLGNAIGNSLDVREAIETLRGEHDGTAFYDICMQLAANMLLLADLAEDKKDAFSKLADAMKSGAALNKLRLMIEAQGGDPRVCEDTSLLGMASSIVPLSLEQSGYISGMDAAKVGMAAQMLGAGRARKGDEIDHVVGIYMQKRVGDHVDIGETVADFHVNKQNNLNEAMQLFRSAISIGDERVSAPLLLRTVTATEEEHPIG